MRPRLMALVAATFVAAAVGVIAWRQPASTVVAETSLTLAPATNAVTVSPVPSVAPNPPSTPPTTNSPAPSPVVAGFIAKAREANAALAAATLTNASAPRPFSPTANPATEMQLARTDDGAWLVDQLYVVRGQGTTNEPYLVTWDLLLSAAETYTPAAGSWELPKRLRWLDGKQLQIKGFLTSPTRANKSDHLLLTWSALDACCLGPPPNPCQAVEVKLESPITLDRHVLIGVTVEGSFKLEPHLAGGLGLSLFRLDHARVIAVGGR